MTTTTTAVSDGWPRTKIDLVKRTCCPQGITDDEFGLFVEQCRRTGLDPLTKQAFCVPRRAKVNNQWVEQYVFQAAESGMLARADEFPDYLGTTGSAVHVGDGISIDPGKGVVNHTFSPEARGKLLGAWAKVERVGRTPVVKYLRVEDYIQTYPDGKPTAMWASKAATMALKCAKVAALRDAFPRVFGGVYIGEEMPALEHTHAPEPRVLPATTADPDPAPRALPTSQPAAPPPGPDIPPAHRQLYWQDQLDATATPAQYRVVAKTLADAEPLDSPLRTGDPSWAVTATTATRVRLGMAQKGGAA